MAAQQPTYQAYTVVKRQGKEGAQDDFWLKSGRRSCIRTATASTSSCRRFPSTARSSCVHRNRMQRTKLPNALSKRSARKTIAANAHGARSNRIAPTQRNSHSVKHTIKTRLQRQARPLRPRSGLPTNPRFNKRTHTTL
jgi:hypothetical protein